jgi:acyl dehydratase
VAERCVDDAKPRLYLEDLRVGKRFTSDTHAVDESQIRAFATEFDPQPFHLDDKAARASLFAGLAASGWHTAAITMRLLVSGGRPAGCRSPVASSARAVRSTGRNRRDPATFCAWRARSSRSGRHDPAPIAAW